MQLVQADTQRAYQQIRGKIITLEGVLVAGLELDLAHGSILLVPHAAGAVRRRVERDLDFHSPAGAEGVDTLIVRQLGRTGEGGYQPGSDRPAEHREP